MEVVLPFMQAVVPFMAAVLPGTGRADAACGGGQRWAGSSAWGPWCLRSRVHPLPALRNQMQTAAFPVQSVPRL
eukprot:2937019-Rhodomonas_salina.1